MLSNSNLIVQRPFTTSLILEGTRTFADYVPVYRVRLVDVGAQRQQGEREIANASATTFDGDDSSDTIADMIDAMCYSMRASVEYNGYFDILTDAEFMRTVHDVINAIM